MKKAPSERSTRRISRATPPRSDRRYARRRTTRRRRRSSHRWRADGSAPRRGSRDTQATYPQGPLPRFTLEQGFRIRRIDVEACEPCRGTLVGYPEIDDPVATSDIGDIPSGEADAARRQELGHSIDGPRVVIPEPLVALRSVRRRRYPLGGGRCRKQRRRSRRLGGHRSIRLQACDSCDSPSQLVTLRHDLAKNRCTEGDSFPNLRRRLVMGWQMNASGRRWPRLPVICPGRLPVRRPS
jgi:hypothetical protein